MLGIIFSILFVVLGLIEFMHRGDMMVGALLFISGAAFYAAGAVFYKTHVHNLTINAIIKGISGAKKKKSKENDDTDDEIPDFLK